MAARFSAISSTPDRSVLRPRLYSGAERIRLDPNLLLPSRTLGYCQSLGNLCSFVLVLWISRGAHSVWQFAICYVAVGVSLHRLFFPVHDCIHYSLFPTKTENRFVGSFLSALMGTSYDAIRTQHLEHHRDFGMQQDPGAADYFVRFRSRREFAIFLLSPLFGSVLFSKLRDYLLRPGQNAYAEGSHGAENKSSLFRRLRAYGVILGVQTGVCALLTRGFQLNHLWRYPVFNILPLVTVFLFLVRLRMFLEHGSLNYEVCDYLEGRRPTARSIYASRVERVILCGSDFNFHHEHHLYPGVPGWQLPRLHRELRVRGLDSEDVRQTYLQSLREIWEYLSK